jgi:hypothetical protein
MNKLFVSLTAAGIFTLTGCDMIERPAAPVVATPTPAVVTASAPAPAATASVVCKDEAKTATSIANGDGARAAASCGKKVKVIAKTVKPAQKTVVASTGDSDMVRALVARNMELQAQLANRQAQAGTVVGGDAIMVAAVGKFAPAPSYAEKGVVYSDAGGNTFERIQGGDRLCRFYVQGELRGEKFVSHPDPVESKKMCDRLAQVFQAGMTPTTPEK